MTQTEFDKLYDYCMVQDPTTGLYNRVRKDTATDKHPFYYDDTIGAWYPNRKYQRGK